MKITMIGHAGVFIETAVGGILLDPWLQGPAFNGSWNLLEPSYTPDDLWDRVKWIWFSHEHPDHFHPESIRNIPRAKREEIVILFQKTKDKKVITWLANNSFNVKELSHGKFFVLGSETRVYLESVSIYDSWILIEDGSERILDLNDCAIGPQNLKRISKLFAKIDALITQFSFASWIGNPNDPLIQAVAERYLTKFYEQITIIKPDYVIPAASFIKFSHSDNFWMNDYRNSIDGAVAKIYAAGSTPIVLKPGNIWAFESGRDNTNDINHYRFQFAMRDFPLHSDPSIAVTDLINDAAIFSKRLRERNNLFLLRLLKLTTGFLSPISFFITDHQNILCIEPLSKTAAAKVITSSYPADISIHSSALRQLLLQPSGIDTLIVSAVFKSADGYLDKLHNSFNVVSLNNAGIGIKFADLLSITTIKIMVRIAIPWARWKKQNMRLRWQRQNQSH